ncbi:hypothetical protein [Shinella sp.]|uniref:hypothetical protein n=1 Tax=Shinella sp. TaxID=1870904 RepID=UPI00289DF469|nr:hypothetical protein [Shinella sp.]
MIVAGSAFVGRNGVIFVGLHGFQDRGIAHQIGEHDLPCGQHLLHVAFGWRFDAKLARDLVQDIDVLQVILFELGDLCAELPSSPTMVTITSPPSGLLDTRQPPVRRNVPVCDPMKALNSQASAARSAQRNHTG